MVTLIILDGCGIRKERYGNAVKASGMPNLKKLMKKYPHTQINASGLAVGLPEGVMGNSEVGHLTIGSGRVVYQDLVKINKEIESGDFGKNPRLVKALEYAKKSGRLHLIGLLSDGAVHSHINHLFALLDEAKKYNIKEIFVHVITDGRDTLPDSAIRFVDELNTKLPKNAKIASICGRFYAMDREKRWDRVKEAYDMLTKGKEIKKSIYDAINESYNNGVFDEFIKPTLLCKDGIIKDGDSVIFYNYRADRAREITYAFTDEKFDKFKVKKFKNLMFSPMEEYSTDLNNLNILYPPEVINDNLASIISKNGLKQYHISETTKYAHVTFFLNGGIENAYPGEERKLIESIETANFEYYPQMRAHEITTELLDAIASQKYDFLVVNYSNLDMVGHTGNFNATKEACDCVDKCAYAVTLASLMAGGEVIITADHGNAEYMFDEKGNKITSHTTNPVPFVLVSRKKKYKLIKNGGLSNIAPTILKLLNIEIPKSMDKPMIK